VPVSRRIDENVTDGRYVMRKPCRWNKWGVVLACRFSRHTWWHRVRGEADAAWPYVVDWATQPQPRTAPWLPTLVVQAFEQISWLSRRNRHRRRRRGFIARSTWLAVTTHLLLVVTARLPQRAMSSEPASAIFSDRTRRHLTVDQRVESVTW